MLEAAGDPGEVASNGINVILNFFEALKERVPTGAGR